MKRQDDFLVGLVVILAIAAVTALALFLSHAQLGASRRTVLARTREVGGIQVGSPVVIRGVEAGRITGIILNEKDGWVEVRVTLDRGMTLPVDPVLLFSEASLFGKWQATLQTRSTAPENSDVRAQLDDPAARKDGAIPGAVLPGVADLTVVAGRIATDVETVARRFGTAFSDSAARELRLAIRNIEILTETLNSSVGKQSKNLDKISGQLGTAITSIESAAGAIERTTGRLDSATARGEVKDVITNVRAASEDLKEMAAQLRKSASSLSRTTASFESMVSHVDSVAVKVNRGQGSLGLLVNDPSLYRDTDSLMVALRALAVDVKARPSRYVNVKIF
ncbi:MAG TPA: MlaD family protein [Gemmatimonadaceae bacterium]|nr:MlaD family protein [Gemmatimonadaceae bacterium]